MGKEMVRIIDNTQKNPELKQYLICLALNDAADLWDIVTGRTAAYELIKDCLIFESVNFERSFILVESCKLNERKSIYAFMKYVGDFYDDGFDIDEYIKGDWDEEEFKRINDISLEVDNSAKVGMESFMDGNISMNELK